MREHLDAITIVCRDMFYCILASKLRSQKRNLPPDHKITEKKDAHHFFLIGLRARKICLVLDSNESLHYVSC